MITDDTILEKLRWQQFDRLGESYRVARQKYVDVLSYVFSGLDTTNFRVYHHGIEIKPWQPDEGNCFKGIQLNFWGYPEQRTHFRCIEFKGAALDFKAKVWQKFETLKSLRDASDNQTAIEGSRRIAEAIEIRELTEIAKRAFDKYQVTISKNTYVEGYKLELEIEFNDKRELLNFCDKENL